MDNFIKENNIYDKDEDEKNTELINNLKESKLYLNNMYSNLQFADSDLIDYYTYQIKAEEAKYNYLLKEIKNRKIKWS